MNLWTEKVRRDRQEMETIKSLRKSHEQMQ